MTQLAYVGRSLSSLMHPVTRLDVAEAKRLMAGGMSMTEAANALNVLRSDLDRNLFAWLGSPADVIAAPVRRIYPADF